jgi:hypothetical protein
MESHQTRKKTVLDLESLLVNLSLYVKPDGTKREGLTPDRFTRRALEAG